MKRVFPKQVYVRHEQAGGDSYLIAETQAGICVEDDGPTIVGVYTLVKTIKVKKQIVVE